MTIRWFMPPEGDRCLERGRDVEYEVTLKIRTTGASNLQATRTGGTEEESLTPFLPRRDYFDSCPSVNGLNATENVPLEEQTLQSTILLCELLDRAHPVTTSCNTRRTKAGGIVSGLYFDTARSWCNVLRHTPSAITFAYGVIEQLWDDGCKYLRVHLQAHNELPARVYEIHIHRFFAVAELKNKRLACPLRYWTQPMKGGSR